MHAVNGANGQTLSKDERAKSLIEAAMRLRNLGRESSELPLLKAAAELSSSTALQRMLFWSAQRGGDVATALTVYRQLISTYSKQKTAAAKSNIEKLNKASVSTLALLDQVQPPAMPLIESIPGRLLYLLNYTLPQVSNGYATRAHGMALGMKECGLDVVCMTRPGFPLDLKPAKPFVAYNNVDGIDYLHDPAPVLLGTSNLSAYVRGAADVIEKRLRELKPQVLMAASNYNNALPGLIAARRVGIPFWYEVRGFWEITRLSREPEIETTFNYQLQRALETLVACNSDRVFTLTTPMREELELRGVAADRIELVPNSCDPTRFIPRDRDTALAKKLGLPKDVPVIGYIGSFAPYEGLEDLALACAKLRQQGLEFRLLLVGGESASNSEKGPVTQEVERIAQENGLGDWLIMTGRVPHDEVEAHYSLIDITPFPRRSQLVTEMVSPLKPLEALAMGKAVTVPSLRALEEMIKHDETGLIYAKGDLDSFTAVLARLLKDPALRERLGTAGRDWVMKERTWTRTAGTIAAAMAVPEAQVGYERLIAQKGFLDAEQIIYADIDLNTVDGSAIWMSSMTSILASGGKTILISKNPILRTTIVDNILHPENVLILTPETVDPSVKRLDMPACIGLIRKLDHILPKLRKVVVRGLAAATELVSDRQFYKRSYLYLTDLYEHNDQGITVKPVARKTLDMLARQSAALLVQTASIEKLMRQLTDHNFKAIALPPPVPDDLIEKQRISKLDQSVIRIGYAGKIAPQWGIQQLIAWVETLNKEGFKIEVTIIGDKIAGAASPEANKIFRKEIIDGLERIKARRLGAVDRAAVTREMEAVDFAWCWRPADFENHTLELSTKLVEGVVAGIPCITYPSQTNKDCLGEDYPFFAKNIDEFRAILEHSTREVPSDLRKKIHHLHSISAISARFENEQAPSKSDETSVINFATHAAKFIEPYYSDLKARGYPVTFDSWNWGGPVNELDSMRRMNSSDTIFCEWGLANAAWYSNNIPDGKRLIVRVHAQEVRGSALKFGKDIDVAKVDKFIFVSEWVQREAIRLFGWPEDKTSLIPNFVLENEYEFSQKNFRGPIRLGMVGIVPQQKRFDRMVDIAEVLAKQGHAVELHIKGPRPETIPFMQMEKRADELKYYQDLDLRVQQNPTLRGNIHFHDWGNDVAAFYGTVDHILSMSESESFHYALADGVLSGCHPVIWDRPDTAKTFSADWVVSNAKSAADKIMSFRDLPEPERYAELMANRALVVSRYGSKSVYDQIDKLIIDAEKH